MDPNQATGVPWSDHGTPWQILARSRGRLVESVRRSAIVTSVERCFCHLPPHVLPAERDARGHRGDALVRDQRGGLDADAPPALVKRVPAGAGDRREAAVES